MHHGYTAPVAYAAFVAHPVEHVFVNALPVALPAKIMRVHVVTGWVYLALQLVEVATVHSGFDFLWGVGGDA